MGLGFRGLGGLSLWVQGLRMSFYKGFRDFEGLGLQASRFGLRTSGVRLPPSLGGAFRVQGLGFRVWGVELNVIDFGKSP